MTAIELHPSAIDAPEADEGDADVRYGTRWGRAGLVIAPVIALIAAFAGALVTGVLALSFTVQGGTIGLRLEGVQANSLAIYPLEVTTKARDSTTAGKYLVALEVGGASFTGLCGAQTYEVLGQQFTFRLKVDGGSAATILALLSEAKINRAGLDSPFLKFNKNAAETRIGTSGRVSQGLPNLLGIEADWADVDLVTGQVHAATITQVNANNANISVVPGAHAC